MKTIKYIMLSLGAVLLTTSCSDSFLDKNPDERTAIDSKDKVISLMVDAYPSSNPAFICEFSSDNVVDNNAHHYNATTKRNVYYNLNSRERMHDEIYKFEPVMSSTGTDSPSAVWSGYYGSISVANHALAAIDELTGGDYTHMSDSLRAARAEALLVRAFSHFMLVNIFSQAYKDPETSKQDIGVPYVTEPETEVGVHYDRINVAQVYENIEKDLEEGLAGISDVIFKKPKWHFNTKAAHAFATRFYLFKRDYDKVIQHADAILGTDRAMLPSMLIDYSSFGDDQTYQSYAWDWQGSQVTNNIMLINTYSLTARRFSGAERYAHNAEASHATVDRFGPTWHLSILPPSLTSGLFINGSQDYGLYWAKIAEEFEYTDKVAGIGYPRTVRTEFTNSEVLLNRIEAEILCSRHDTINALADLNAIQHSWCTTPRYRDTMDDDLTLAHVQRYYEYPGDINASYDNQRSAQVVWSHDQWLNSQKMSSSFIIPQDCEKWMNALMDYRRIEMLFSGMRFFDLKRFGYEYSHIYSKEDIEYKLTWNDPRRAIEVPQEVLAAGLESSRPTVKAENHDSDLEKQSPKAYRYGDNQSNNN